MWANSEGSGETARMRRLAWAFAGRLCDKFHNLVSWLIYELHMGLTSGAYLLGVCRHDQNGKKSYDLADASH